MDDEKKESKTGDRPEYDPSDEAPRVVASGKGILADKIIEKVRRAACRSIGMTSWQILCPELDIGEMIPPELYEVVAEILVFVDAVDHRMVKENVADGGKHKN